MSDINDYLKEGETPLECIQRNRRDLVNTLGDWAEEKKKTEALEKRIAELERLHAPMVRFVQEALDLSLDGCDYDGYDIQEDLHRYGLLEQQTMTEACDYCRCARYAGFPRQCYRVIPEFIAAREALKEAGDE